MTHKDRSRSAIRLLLLFVPIFALAPLSSAEWNEKVLYSFQGGTDGAFPAGGVVFDKQGNLYGATQQGGGTNCSPMAACGTVYQVVPPAKQGSPWTENVLHIFQGKQHNDGEFPSGGVIADALGNIYGTSSYGGTGDCILLGIKGGCGTVFELTPPQTKGGQWTYKILYSFKGGKDGYLPFGDLVFDGAGNLYGVTYFGGGKGTTCNPYYQYCGTVFELSPPKTKGGKWTEKVLHSFAGGTDGANPNGGLVLGAKGNIYGATAGGGGTGCQGPGCGTVFEITLPAKKGLAWTENMLHRFTDGNDGAGPNGGLILDTKGALYGTAGGGGNPGVGVIFRLTPTKASRWVETVLYNFTVGNGGRSPQAGLTMDGKGDLYGTALGGPYFSGVVFQLRPPALQGKAWAYRVLYSQRGQPDGHYPAARVILDASGSLYGTTEGGGTSSNGTVFTALRRSKERRP